MTSNVISDRTSSVITTNVTDEMKLSRISASFNAFSSRPGRSAIS